MKIYIAGNPNVGKSTLFNSLTNSHEHTGNFHGVTVDEKEKVVKINGDYISFIDLPGIYSLNTFTPEEEVAKTALLNNDGKIILLCDANSLRRNLYLSLQLKELKIDHKILINNYDYFVKNGNSINLDKLSELWGNKIEQVNAKKIKLGKLNLNFNSSQGKASIDYLKKYDVKTILNYQEGGTDIDVEKTLICDRYAFIDSILSQAMVLKKDYIYAYSKLDKILLNPVLMGILSLLVFFATIYFVFFLIGPIFSSGLSKILNYLIIEPFMNILYGFIDNIWILEFFRVGVFASISTIMLFLPQVIIMFMVLTLLEDSGIIARLSYVFDDIFSKIGLNGKAVYVALLGFGCNTMSNLATKNLNGKNLQAKSAIVNPYISCMARLPVYALVAGAVFAKKSYLIIISLYVLGLCVAGVMARLLNKTILPTEAGDMLLEFPPLKVIDIKHILDVSKTNTIEFLKRVFSTILSVGIIVYLLTHTNFDLRYTGTISDSILFLVLDKLKFIFAPIGLDNAGMVTALVVGVFAKELIVSTMGVLNCTIGEELSASLLISSSIVHFSKASAIVFLLFSLLYCPCISTLSVIKKQNGKFVLWFTILSELSLAYFICFVVNAFLSYGFVIGLFSALVVLIILWAFVKLTKKLHCSSKCSTCGICKRN